MLKKTEKNSENKHERSKKRKISCWIQLLAALIENPASE